MKLKNLHEIYSAKCDGTTCSLFTIVVVLTSNFMNELADNFYGHAKMILSYEING